MARGGGQYREIQTDKLKTEVGQDLTNLKIGEATKEAKAYAQAKDSTTAIVLSTRSLK
jgi:hypothetical protein